MDIMEKILSQLTEISRESSNNSKVDLLRTCLEEDEFRIVVEMALDEQLHYNIKKLPETDISYKTKTPDFYALINYLHFLSDKQGATMKEKYTLVNFGADDNWTEIIRRIVNKDLKCGAAAKLVNQAIPGMINVIPYQQYSGFKKVGNVVFPAYAQEKEDGLFVNIIHHHKSVDFLSRNGNIFLFPEDSLYQMIWKWFPEYDDSVVYHGEFRISGLDGKYLPRKEGNGIINKALKKNGTQKESESRRIHFICWDIIPEKDWRKGIYSEPYEYRFEKIKNLPFEHLNNRIHLSETIIVNNVEEAAAFALRKIEDGKEGGILKSFRNGWKNTKSTSDVKMKAGGLGKLAKRDCELRITGWYYGKPNSKYEKCLGGLHCESEDHKLEVNVGIGYSDLERGYHGRDKMTYEPIIRPDFEDFADEYINGIMSASFNEVIQAKSGKKPSLFLPRVLELRSDKNVADTLEYIVEQ